MVEVEQQSPVTVSTILPSRPPRPPTPPRESNHNTAKAGLLGRLLNSASRISSSPPDHTSAESSLDLPTTSIPSRKRVGFSEATEYEDPASTSYDSKGSTQRIIQPLPPSAERKPRKSILKAYNGAHEQDFNSLGSTKLLPPHHHATFATMLESIVQQLAGKDRSSKMDAYLMLSGSLKASDNVPDLKALKDKMGLLCHFISRDLNERLENGKSDSGLIVNALVLLSSFLQRPAIAETFPAEFPGLLVNHAINVFENGSMSKDVIKHLMFVLSYQNFSAKVMNQDRVSKLISAVHNVEQHVQGKSIAVARISIYRALLRHPKSHMLANTIWVKDLFTDMLSSLKEIRGAAITFGLESSFALGTESSASRAVSSLFKLEFEGQESFAEYYARKLAAIVKEKVDSSTVPQAWSVIILFLRSKPQQLAQWQFLKLFLDILQLCFNSSDHPTRIEANYAWNRFVFVKGWLLSSDNANRRTVVNR